MSAATDRSINSILNELDFLVEENVVTRAEINGVVTLLSGRTRKAMREKPSAATTVAPSGTDSPSTLSVASSAQPTAAATPLTPDGPAVSHARSEEIVEALYDFEPHEKTDLGLRPGMKIAVYEHLNEHWWRGRDLASGQEGVFPTNYVRVLPQRAADAGEKKNPQHGDFVAAPTGYNEKTSYDPPGGAPPSAMSPHVYQPPNYTSPQVQVYQPPPPQQQMMVQQQPPQQPVYIQQAQPQSEHHHHRPHMPGSVKRFGQRFGDAAIFGAGATLGSDIINKIF